MESAKAKVKEFLSHSGQHDTTVHERTAPAVTNEQITRTEREELTPAIDKEVHKDHYHTSVQPIRDAQTLEEQHHTKVLPTESRSFEHDNADEVKRNLAEQHRQFKDTTHHVKGEHTSTNVPVVAGEHRHHHVHETIQPVIERQTIEPHVVHTTVPVHEVHHDISQHHSGSTLPAMTMEEFQQHDGKDVRTQHFKGEPQLASNVASGAGFNASRSGEPQLDTNVGSGTHSHSARSGEPQLGTNVGSGTHSHSALSGEPRLGSDVGSGTHSNLSQLEEPQLSSNVASGAHSTPSRSAPHGEGHTFGTMDGGSRNADPTSTSTTAKPSLMDKMNPRKDADGDGKAGFMK